MIKQYLLAASLLVSASLFGQLEPGDFQNNDAYEEAKKALSNSTLVTTTKSDIGKNSETSSTAVQKSGACWYPLDASFTTLTSTDLEGGTMDDGYWGPIALGFNYVLYGVTYTELYINTNGNITFGGGYTSYTPAGFPDAAGPAMIAPFWSDVDLRGTGIDNTVYYKIDGNKIIIIWNEVGYWSSQIAPTNTFQILLSDGSDPYIGVGSNSMFAYDAMDWAVGEFGLATGGFGTDVFGTAGAQNAGGANYYQIGLFEYDDASYDGPAGANDGIHYLDNGCFITSLDGLNTPPISSNFPTTTIDLCVGETYNLSSSYSAPELTQTTTTTVTNSSLNAASWSTTIVDGVLSTQNLILTPSATDVGMHTLTYTSTDNGTPGESTTNTVLINVLAAPIPTIIGLTEYCTGSNTTLDAGAGYVSYTWLPNGETNQTVSANSSEMYSVSVYDGTCTGVASVLITESMPSAGTDVQIACESYLWIDGNTYNQSNNIATHVIPNAAGCDSTITLNLTINSSTSSTDIQTACDSYTWIDGNTYTADNNTATWTETNAAGCDSVVTLDLSVTPLPDNNVTQVGSMLTAVQAGAAYIWLDCNDNNAIINGEPNQSYNPPLNGNYAVEVTLNGCSDTSACYLIDYTGLSELYQDVISIHPNPASDLINIIGMDEIVGLSHIEIVSSTGKLISIISEKNETLDISELSNGVYFLKIIHNQGKETIRFVKL